MSAGHVSRAVRRRVAESAGHRCGYCLMSQAIIGPLLEIDHLIPEAAGGSSDEDNLWLACPHCNGAKAARTEAEDPVTGEMAALFNPRRELWLDHFAWDESGALIVGLTPVGRATIQALNMNHPDIVAARRLWVEAGWHPPQV